VDARSPEQRRRIMQAVGTNNTSPELIVRKLLFRMGYRYRLHRRGLPGTPDIVFPGRKKAIFVHGCFWHSHACPKGRPPKSRLDYWETKLLANRLRDGKKQADLAALGWAVLVVWQCETRDPVRLEATLRQFVDK